MDIDLNSKLKTLGLTSQEIAAYTTLVARGSLNAKQIAKELTILPNAAYRTAYGLAKKGFVTVTEKYPIEFQAVAPPTAIAISAEKQTHELQDLVKGIGKITQNIESNPHPTEVQLIYGAENIFEEAAKLLDLAQKEMLVISIGESISNNLLLSVRNAIQRGVSIRMIAHKYDETNKEVLENLKKNGYKIRHYQGWGFHMAIYDQAKTILIINNPQNTSERVAMFINSSGFSEALCDYFNSTWKKAKIV